MIGYFEYQPSEAFPLGILGKTEDGCAWLYHPEKDDWERWPDGDTLDRDREVWGCITGLTDEKADFLKYRLQVAEALTHYYGNDYLDGRNFQCVLENEDYILAEYMNGETPRGTAIDIGYTCG